MEREIGFETAPQPWRAALYQLSYPHPFFVREGDAWLEDGGRPFLNPSLHIEREKLLAACDEVDKLGRGCRTRSTHGSLGADVGSRKADGHQRLLMAETRPYGQ